MTASTARMPRVLASLCLLLACNPEGTGTPSIVGSTWTVQIGGTAEASQQREASRVEFLGVGKVQAVGDDRYGGPCCAPPGSLPLVIQGESSFQLPPAPPTLDAVQQLGVKVVAVTYCLFVNEAGKPRDEDVQSVNTAVSVFAAALDAPFREATVSNEGLAAAGRQVADSLLANVLDELGNPSLDDAASQSAFVRLLKFRRDGEHAAQPVEDLVAFLPSMVSTYGDATTQNTLHGCGSLLLFDVPEDLRRREFSTGFLEGFCGGGGVPTEAVPCSLDTPSFPDSGVDIALREPIDSEWFAQWIVQPVVRLSPL